MKCNKHGIANLYKPKDKFTLHMKHLRAVRNRVREQQREAKNIAVALQVLKNEI